MSLLELAIGLAVTGLVGAVVVGALAQVTVIPANLILSLNAVDDVRDGSTFLANDIRYAQVFVPGQQSVYGTFESADFTAAAPSVESSTYRYDSGKKALLHDVSSGGATQEQLVIVSGLAGVNDFSITVDQGAVTVNLRKTGQGSLGAAVTTATFLQAIEAPGPTPVPTAGPPSIRPEALCFGGPLSIAGSSNTITGGGTVNGVLTLSGADNVLVGDFAATGGLALSGSGNTTGPVSTSGPATCGLRLGSSSFQPFDFAFSTDTTLRDVPSVWQDPRRRVLKPGVYFVNGTLTLDGDHVSGDVTFIANRIVLEGSDIALTPRKHGVLALALGGSDPIGIEASGSGNHLSGVVFSDTRDTTFSGEDNLLDGALIARTGAGSISGENNRISFNQTHFQAAAQVSQ